MSARERAGPTPQLMERYTGPDPREESTTPYRATLTITMEVETTVTTCNRDSWDAGHDELNEVSNALEALGYTVNVTNTEIER